MLGIGLLSSICVSLGDGVFSFNQSLDTVDHVLDEGSFSLTESSLVRDIVGTIIRLRVLSVDSSDLDVELISNLVELILLLSKLWELDMNGSSHGGTEVGWARGDVT